MSNQMYVPFKATLWGGTGLHRTDVDNDVIRATFVDTGVYSLNITTHDAFDDIGSGAQATSGGSATVGGITIVGANWTASPTTFTAVTGSASLEAIVLSENTAGADSTDPLMGFYDTFGGGMPVTPNTGNIIVTWNASGVMTL